MIGRDRDGNATYTIDCERNPIFQTVPFLKYAIVISMHAIALSLPWRTVITGKEEYFQQGLAVKLTK